MKIVWLLLFFSSLFAGILFLGSQPKQSNLKAAAHQAIGADFRKLDPTWHVPIDFYGKVVDENGTPVSDAKIVFHWKGWASEEKPPLITNTDAQGLFALLGKRGKGILVSVSRNLEYDPAAQRKPLK